MVKYDYYLSILDFSNKNCSIFGISIKYIYHYMEHIEKLEFEYLLANINLSNVSLYRDTIAVIDVENTPNQEQKLKDKKLSLRLEFIMLIFAERGELKMNIDYVSHTISENKFVVLTIRHIIQFISASENFKGHLVIAESNSIKSLLGEEKPPLTKDFNYSILFNPVVQLKKEEYILLKNNVERLKYNILRKEHPYHSKLIGNEFANLIFEIWNFYMIKSEKEIVTQEFGNREHIVNEFLKLLFMHSRQQREVAFYANKLCITPVYLSRSVKHIIGMPAIKIINDMVISDAKLLLRKQKTTIQEVSEKLNFPDQATFSKFFKIHTGEPPIKYKQRNQ